MLSIFRKTLTTDRELNRVQDQILAALNPVVRSTLLNYNEVKNIAITTAGLAIEHGLGRQPLGWVVTDIDANATVWKTAWDERFLTLDASGTANISILVY